MKKQGKQDTSSTRVLITSTEKIAEGMLILRFRRSFEFVAGQVIGIGLEEDGPRRLYSICSGSNEPEIAILYNVVSEGYLTPRLSEMKSGNSIWIAPPRGDFIYQDEPAIWIATGTGIAPFYSMLRSGRHANALLLHGERGPERFAFCNEFAKLMGDRYIRCSSRRKEPDLFHGRVTDFLNDWQELPADRNYYLCGRAEMVVEVRDILISRGVAYHRILSEIYF